MPTRHAADDAHGLLIQAFGAAAHHLNIMHPAIDSHNKRANYPALHTGIIFSRRIGALMVYKLEHGTVATGKFGLLVNIVAEICMNFMNSTAVHLHTVIGDDATGLGIGP